MKFCKRLQDGKITIIKTYKNNAMIQFWNSSYKIPKEQDLYEILKKTTYFFILFIFPIYKNNLQNIDRNYVNHSIAC
jgi:hypothetical protein